MNIYELKNPVIIQNLASQQIKGKYLEMLKFILDFCEIVGVNELDIRWAPGCTEPWIVSPHLEFIGGGIRTGITGWGIKLKDAIDAVYDYLRSGKIIGSMNMRDDRRWNWDQNLDRWHTFLKSESKAA